MSAAASMTLMNGTPLPMSDSASVLLDGGAAASSTSSSVFGDGPAPTLSAASTMITSMSVSVASNTGPCGWFAYDITSGTNALACPGSSICLYNTDISIIQCGGTLVDLEITTSDFTIEAELFTGPAGQPILGPSAVLQTGCVPSASASGSSNPYLLSCTASSAPFCATGVATTLGATLSAFACASSPRPASLSTGTGGDFSLWTYATSTSKLASPSNAAVLYLAPTLAQQPYYADQFGTMTYNSNSDPAINAVMSSDGLSPTAPTASTTITTTLPTGVSSTSSAGASGATGATSSAVPKSAAGPSVRLGLLNVKQILGAAVAVAACALYL